MEVLATRFDTHTSPYRNRDSLSALNDQPVELSPSNRCCGISLETNLKLTATIGAGSRLRCRDQVQVSVSVQRPPSYLEETAPKEELGTLATSASLWALAFGTTPRISTAMTILFCLCPLNSGWSIGVSRTREDLRKVSRLFIYFSQVENDARCWSSRLVSLEKLSLCAVRWGGFGGRAGSLHLPHTQAGGQDIAQPCPAATPFVVRGFETKRLGVVSEFPHHDRCQCDEPDRRLGALEGMKGPCQVAAHARAIDAETRRCNSHT